PWFSRPRTLTCSWRLWIPYWPAWADGVDALQERLISLIETHWPLRCTSIEPIKVRENAVYAVHLRDGGKAVLRIHRCGYHSDEALLSESIWMRALGHDGIDVPRHVLSRAGNPFERLTIEGFGPERQVDVFHWIDGQQLGSVEGGVAVH